MNFNARQFIELSGQAFVPDLAVRVHAHVSELLGREPTDLDVLTEEQAGLTLAGSLLEGQPAFARELAAGLFLAGVDIEFDGRRSVSGADVERHPALRDWIGRTFAETVSRLLFLGAVDGLSGAGAPEYGGLQILACQASDAYAVQIAFLLPGPKPKPATAWFGAELSAFGNVTDARRVMASAFMNLGAACAYATRSTEATAADAAATEAASRTDREGA